MYDESSTIRRGDVQTREVLIPYAKLRLLENFVSFPLVMRLSSEIQDVLNDLGGRDLHYLYFGSG